MCMRKMEGLKRWADERRRRDGEVHKMQRLEERGIGEMKGFEMYGKEKRKKGKLRME